VCFAIVFLWIAVVFIVFLRFALTCDGEMKSVVVFTWFLHWKNYASDEI